MSDHPTTPAPLDRYLDGLMSPAEVAAFERTIANDPSLARESALQGRIDASLERLFAYEEQTADKRLPEPEPIPFVRPARAWRRYGLLGIAAALVVAAIFVYRPREEFKLIAPEALYTRLNTTGWQPAFTCKNDAEFVQVVRKRLRQGLLIPANAAGVALDGWGYSSNYNGTPISPETMVLMAHVGIDPATRTGGEPALLLIDRAANARKIKLPPASPLHMFEGRRGDLILYEITPLDKPMLIDAAEAK